MNRLREERHRLYMTAEAFGRACGVGKSAQLNYERDERSPDAAYLAAAATLGADVLYIVTGQHSISTPVEQQLLDRFRAASPVLQQAALAVLGITATALPASYLGAASSEVGQVVQGTTISQGCVDIRVGSKKRGRKG